MCEAQFSQEHYVRGLAKHMVYYVDTTSYISAIDKLNNQLLNKEKYLVHFLMKGKNEDINVFYIHYKFMKRVAVNRHIHLYVIIFHESISFVVMFQLLHVLQ